LRSVLSELGEPLIVVCTPGALEASGTST